MLLGLSKNKLMETFNHTSILTLDDIYNYSNIHNISVISIYRKLSIMIKENEISKVLFEYNGNDYFFADKDSFDTEIGFIKKTKVKTKTNLLTQGEIENFF